jgi:hypothetical protein
MFQNYASSEIYYSSVVEESVFLDCDVVSLVKQFPTFRRNVSLSSSRVKRVERF